MTIKGTSFQLKKFGSAPSAVEKDFAEPKGREVLLRVAYSGVCHSDVYIMDGYQDLGDGDKMDFADSDMPIPLTMGHEIVGDIVAVGDEIDPELIGEGRLVYPWIGCGECISCKAGQDNHCENACILGIFRDGGYADYVLVPDAKYLVGIDGVDPSWACTLACSGLTVFSAFEQLKPIKPGGYVAIIGLGGLGLMAVSMAAALGVTNIIACDISEDRFAVAEQLGATAVVNTGSTDAIEQLREISGGQLFGVIDTVGLPATMSLGIEACMKGGRIVLVGLQGGKIRLPLPTLPFKALSLIGTYTGTLDELKRLVPLAQSGEIKPMPVEIRPMSCLHETLEDLRKGSVLGRVVLTPSTTA